jgi:hypothetical protein
MVSGQWIGDFLPLGVYQEPFDTVEPLIDLYVDSSLYRLCNTYDYH